MQYPNGRKRQKGTALLSSFVIMTLLAVGAVVYIDSSTARVRQASRQAKDIQTTHLCEAGVQAVVRSFWRSFKTTQNFTTLDASTSGASATSPMGAQGDVIPGVGRYDAAIIGVSQPDSYSRLLKIRSVGWMDLNGNSTLDQGEPQKVVDVTITFALARSQVFDYAYFVNNYGWMNGFSPNDLIVNGDMRANGNFDFSNGSPTVNGSIYAAANDKLSPAAAGLLNAPPVKWDNSTYKTNSQANSTNKADNELRWRPVYDSVAYGAKGTTQYENYRDLTYDSVGSVVNNRVAGAVMADANGTRSWVRTTQGSSPATTMLDPTPTQEVIMPDLSDITYYQTNSQNYVDMKATYSDGTANPNYGKGSFVKVWDSTLNGGVGAYKTVSTSGVVSGSLAMVGTDAHPILIHGPVTFTQDCVLKGTVSGQGTVYTGRNVHIIGSLKYKTKPSFQGTNTTTVDQANEKADLIGLAARGSIILGNTTQFTDSAPLQYMTPPFTKGRYDESGNWIPPFDAKVKDSTGRMKYQSVIADSTINSLSEGVNQVDAILYTNFVGGGDVGTGGSGVIFNGSIISRDEAMVVFSMPMRMNYDNRIRERSLNSTPLIDINLPRSPTLTRNTWQDRGFSFGGQ